MLPILFYVSAAAIVLSATMVVVLPNPLRGAMALICTLGGLSVIYLLLHAQFAATMQLLVYAGAIVVLFVFVIMLLNLPSSVAQRGTRAVVGVGVVVTALAFGLTQMLHVTRTLRAPAALGRDFGSVEQVSTVILGELVLPFEMLSLLLLVAIVGAVVIAKRRL